MTTARTDEAGACGGTYPLEEGDYPVDVARKFDITVEALLAANGFAMDGAGNVAGWPAVGTEIQLPPVPTARRRRRPRRSPPADPAFVLRTRPSGRAEDRSPSQPRSGQRRVGGRRQPAMPWRRCS